jgi:hypothetical protein
MFYVGQFIFCRSIFADRSVMLPGGGPLFIVACGLDDQLAVFGEMKFARQILAMKFWPDPANEGTGTVTRCEEAQRRCDAL